ncbi:hypothetical protein ACDT10_22035 [Mycobacterium intracellulare]|uniref:hypothetical protein n=1 Tax=Mycobacterium TaxID=1763 RepID=UPI0004D3CF69|nr:MULTISPECIES: hypothetical protein [Mycobacterium]ARR77668.1 hypothetical protein MOTT12_02004 [Mycobacterium intracellulare subsp. yongonense]ARR82786.1 hypothetical protein MOTT27_01965 [Mycobacterium intracellulare subsp. yongonense]KEF96783.1 hypothetical protein K883_03824 [Mycobacterium sp. TKK-01-0059]
MGTAIPGAPLNLSRALTVARLHGTFNLAGGLWPMVHRRSFEAVLGPKIDRWLVYTVAGLMACIGVAQTGATADPASLRLARRIGIGSALTLGTIDVLYAPKGRISKMYLVDALAEAGWLAAWAATALNSRQ